MVSQSVRLFLALFVLWVVLVAPAYLVAGQQAVLGLSAAVCLCLLPGIAVFVLQGGPLGGQRPLSGLLIGMGLRLVFVLTAVLVVRQVRPDLPATVFLVWIVPAYLVALAVETRLVVKQNSELCYVSSESARVRAAGSS